MPTALEVWSPEDICKSGSLERLKKLLQGCREYGKSKDTSELLLLCSKYGHSDLIRLLLQHAANPNSKSKNGKSCLHLACTSGSLKSTLALLENGADKRMRCNTGTTAQQLALAVGDHKIASVIQNWVSPWDLIAERNERSKSNLDVESPKLDVLLRLLEQKESLFGDKHQGLTTTLDRLAIEYAANNEIEDAVRCQNRSTTILFKGIEEGDVVDETHELRMQSLYKLGNILLKARQMKEAEETLLKALDHRENVGLSLCRRVFHVLADAYRAQRKYKEESEAYQQIISIIENETGEPDHQLSVYPFCALGRSLSIQNQHGDAHASFATALAITDRHLGPYHLDIAVVLDCFAQSFMESKEFHKAEVLFRRSLEIRERLLHPVEDMIVIRTATNSAAMAVIARGRNSKLLKKKLKK